MTEPALEFNPAAASDLAHEVALRSGQNLTACYQCRRCAAGCPVAEETGYVTPDRLIRMILLGDQQQTLSNPLVWKCVSCYTCGTRCPNDIMTGRITETLKKMAKEAHAEPLEPKVNHFHDAFVKASVRWGRINEGEFISQYQLKNALQNAKNMDLRGLLDEAVDQTRLGIRMLKQKRLHFGFLRAKGRKEIKRFKKIAKKKKPVQETA